jgi:hypothetical protein
LGTQDTKNETEEFVHGGAKNLHFAFTLSGHRVGEGFEAGIVEASDESRHVENLAKESIAGFGGTRAFVNGGAGGENGGTETGIGNELVSGGELASTVDAV